MLLWYRAMAIFWDSVAVIGYFALILTVGLWPNRKQDTMEEFAMGGRSMPWWAVMASILAAEVTAATFIGAPDEGFSMRNYAYAQLALGTILARIIVAYVFIKPYYDFRVVSIYEFLDKRFGKLTKNAASAVFLFTRVLASGARLYIAAVIVVVIVEYFLGERMTDKGNTLWIYAGALALIAGMTALYTSLGGIKAVVWTDVIQATLMYGGLAFALVYLWRDADGWEAVQQKLTAPGDLTIFTPILDPKVIPATPVDKWTVWQMISGLFLSPYTLVGAFIGSTFVTMATHGTDQDMVQRMLTAKDYHKSRWAVIGSGLADIPIVMGFLTIGILLVIYYQKHEHPYLAIDEHGGADNVFAYFIVHEMPAGLRGLLIAGVMATAMGSLSTALNALATSFTRDWWQPYFSGGNPSEKSVVLATRWSTVAFAVLLATVALFTANLALTGGAHAARIIPLILSIAGYTYGALLGIFLLGALTKTRGQDLGNIIGMVTGIVVVSILFDLFGVTTALGKSLGWLADDAPGGRLIAPIWGVFFGTLATLAVAACFPSTKVCDAMPE